MVAFRYSLNTSTIRTTPVLNKICIAAEAGFQGIELWYDDLDAWQSSGRSLPQLKQALANADLVVPSLIHLKNWFQSSDSDFLVAQDDIKRRLEQAAIIGAPFVVAGPPREKTDRGLGAERYRWLLEQGSAYGVRPAIEYLGFAADINTIEDALEIAVRSDHPDACLVLDPFHCHVGGGDLSAISRIPESMIAISHFNDAPPAPDPRQLRDSERLMPGDGVIDLNTYCRLLAQTGYRGFLSLELFRPDLWEQDPLRVALEGREKMEAICQTIR